VRTRNGGQKVGNLRSKTEKIDKLLSIALLWFFLLSFFCLPAAPLRRVTAGRAAKNNEETCIK